MPLPALRSFCGRSQHTRLGNTYKLKSDTDRYQAKDLGIWDIGSFCARSLNNVGRSGRKQRQIARPLMVASQHVDILKIVSMSQVDIWTPGGIAMGQGDRGLNDVKLYVK